MGIFLKVCVKLLHTVSSGSCHTYSVVLIVLFWLQVSSIGDLDSSSWISMDCGAAFQLRTSGLQPLPILAAHVPALKDTRFLNALA